MTSYVGLSTAVRHQLEAQAKQLQGPLIITLHKASHLKNISLSNLDASSPYATLSLGGSKYMSVVRRGGGAHPQWEQQFVFQVGAAAEGQPAASSTGPHDGVLHVRLFDRGVRGDVCIGRVDCNLVQLLAPQDPSLTSERPMSPPAAAPLATPAGSITRWLPVTDALDLRVPAGWLCITAEFKGVGLSDATATSQQLQQTDGADAAKETKQNMAADGNTTDAVPAATSELFTLLTSPRSAPSIVLSLPNPHLAAAAGSSVPAAAVAAAAYYTSPGSQWPTPRPQPPAPGYPAPPPLSAGATPLTSRREHPLSPTAAAAPSVLASSAYSSAAPSKPDVVSFVDEDAEAALLLASEQAQAALITAFDERHEHVLQLLPRAPGGGRFLCAACAGEGHGSVFHCTEGCSFDLHEGCLQREEVVEAESTSGASSRPTTARPVTSSGRALPDLRVDRRHPHPLRWCDSLYDGSYLCGGCGGGGTAGAWHCTTCVFDLHPECMR